MSVPNPCHHPTPNLPDAAAPDGDPLDLAAARELLAAYVDGCRTCITQSRQAVLAGPADVIAHLAELAHRSEGFMLQAFAAPLRGVLGLPEERLTPSAAVTLTDPTRQIYRLLERGDRHAAGDLARRMGREQRAAVLDDAVIPLAQAAIAAQGR